MGISSTCYDLLDVRFELAHVLEADGHIVRQSDCEERVEVDGVTDSIELCLQNIDACDLVILIVDRRYGGLFRKHPKAIESATQLGIPAISATHLEFLHARSKDYPVFCYVRDRTETERGLVEKNQLGELNWIQLATKEADRDDARVAWLKMMDAIHKNEDGTVPWFTTFSTIVDLKKMVVHRVNNLKLKSDRRV